MMKADRLGLYVHIPFCVRKCAYCDFCSFQVEQVTDKSKYLSSLCKEIESYRDRGITLDTVFIGGGTPSLLSGEELSQIFASIRKSFKILADAEITMEANPKTLTPENLRVYLSEGVNRFSLGLQSIHDNELKILGRIHSYADFLESYKLLRDFFVDNINIDLMYGIPNQTLESFSETLDAVCSLTPQHISLYSLILEEGTPLFEKRDDLKFPSEDTDCDMYFTAVDRLASLGYRHYEISNYAMNGRESRHNLKYWHDEEYIGVGLSAYSYFNGVRYGNTSSMTNYLNGAMERSIRSEAIDKATEAYEYVMLALRLSHGFSLEDYKTRFGEDFITPRNSVIRRLVDENYALIRDGRFFLTDRGMYVSNAILTELI